MADGSGTGHRLFEPVTVGGLRLRNRLMMTTHGPRLPEERYLRYLDVRSRDVALVGLHAAWGLSSFPPGLGRFRPDEPVEPDSVPPDPLTPEGREYCERYVAVLAREAAVVHANGALCVGQLHHPGASDHGDVLRAVVGPSPVADEFRRRVPHVLSREEIAALVQVFAETAGRVSRAGLDAVEIHAAHGYLLQQFLSPLTNTRTDRYGGSLERRLQLLLDVVTAVRDAVGGAVEGAVGVAGGGGAGGLPIGVRLPGSEAAEGGLTTEDMCEVAARLEAAGVAYLNVSNGTYTGLRRGLGVAYVAPASVPAGPAVPDAAAIRAVVKIPVVVAGRITDPALAEQIIEDGSADIVGFTRALIADPELFAKLRSGRAGRIDACISCNECHLGAQVRCTVNPAAGREDELGAGPVRHPARLLVVGGGPAGLQFARVAAGRGHRVTLVEQADELGGALCALGADPSRPELEAFRRRLVAAVHEVGVEVRLGTTATPELIASVAPDRVVMATGAAEDVPVPGGADPGRVTTGLAALRGAVPAGGHVVVVGGLEDHLPPLVVASALAARGHRVSLLTQQLVEGEGVEVATRLAYIRRLRSQGVAVLRLTAVEALIPDGLVVRDTLGNERSEIQGVDTVVFVCGRRARTELADGLRASEAAPAIDLIGDCAAPRRLVHATMDATRLAVTV